MNRTNMDKQNKIYCKDCKYYGKTKPPLVLFVCCAPFIIFSSFFLKNYEVFIISFFVLLFFCTFIYIFEAKGCKKNILSKKTYQDNPERREETQKVFSYRELNKNNDCKYFKKVNKQ